jgi:membrane-bound inhibitor of C-type lysozyme
MTNRQTLALLAGVFVSGALATGAAAKPAPRGPFVFACVSDTPADLTVTFLGAKADRARLTYRGKTVLARHAVSADGALYTATDVEFWNKGDDGVLEWYGDKAKCALKESGATS